MSRLPLRTSSNAVFSSKYWINLTSSTNDPFSANTADGTNTASGTINASMITSQKIMTCLACYHNLRFIKH